MSSPLTISIDEKEDDSDDLHIVIESPPKKKSRVEIDEEEKRIFESATENIDRTIEEKAAKANLNVNSVKKILKSVFTNEHLQALVSEEDNSGVSFEPKITRAKAKELLSSSSPVVVSVPPWPISKSSSAVQALITEDLQEDSSGDEYVPGEEYEESDNDSTVISESDPRSVSSIPPTTPTRDTTESQTCFTDDGVFKIPPTKEMDKTTEDANIALRTRSKVSLSSTPLEVIEGAFMPPDITTDMYDMSCDDDDWEEFLKTFTKPLDEVIQVPDDEDHDPEYNILADEDIDQVDKEELRADKAVRVSKKELKTLKSGWFDLGDIYDAAYKQHIPKEVPIQQPAQIMQEESTKTTSSEEDTNGHSLITPDHLPLLEQQLRQHVQMLTQNYLLTFQHPVLADYAPSFKEALLNFKYLSEGKVQTAFYTVNLHSALKLIEEYEQKFANNSTEAEETISYFNKTTSEAIYEKRRGKEYILTFPKLLLQTISQSDVFIYPELLPRIPFHSPKNFPNCHAFTATENMLIALGLEQFIPVLAEDGRNLTCYGNVNLKVAADFIYHHVLGEVSTSTKVYMNIRKCKNLDDKNPIRHYFQHKVAPPTVHNIIALSDIGIVPPCRRPLHMLPYQWQNYVSSTATESTLNGSFIVQCNPNGSPVIQLVQPSIQVFINQTPSTPLRWLLPKPGLIPEACSTPKTTTKRRIGPRNNLRVEYKLKFQKKLAAIVRRCIPLEKLIAVTKELYSDKENLDLNWRTEEIDDEMLPSMPSLFSTPVKNSTPLQNNGVSPYVCDEVSVVKTSEGGDASGDLIKKLEPFLSVSSKSASAFVDVDGPSTSNGSTRSLTKRNLQEKDNMDEINALMKASSTIKSTRKEPSGAEKKRMRTRREFMCNLRMATPLKEEDIDKHNEEFALSYFRKLQETLEQEDYNQVIDILNDVDGTKTDAVDIYNKVIVVLQPKYQELADEFLLFLNDVQAHNVGQLVPYYMVKNIMKFLQKVDLYFQDKPYQIKKIYKTLTDLGATDNISIEKLKQSMLPLLKGSSYLTDLFLQNFVTERPPDSLIADKFETIDLTKELSRPEDEELHESIVIEDMEDKYGNAGCICACHSNTDDVEAASRKKHCVPCGTKYLQGKIFIQTGKGIRPATVRFLTNPQKDHNGRLNGEGTLQTKKKSDSTSKRSTSPMKECHDESRMTKKKEDEGGGKKKMRSSSPKKTPRKPAKAKNERKCSSGPSQKNSSHQSCDKKADSLSVNSVNKSNKVSKTKSPKDSAHSRTSKTKKKEEKCLPEVEASPRPSGSQAQKRSAEEPLEELDLNTSADSAADLKLSSAESESEFCEESSQANTLSDPDDSSNSSITFDEVADNDDFSVTEDMSWTRDEDKVILESFQQDSNKETVFKTMSKCLPNRTIYQIKSRFQTLMSLIQQMTADTRK